MATSTLAHMYAQCYLLSVCITFLWLNKVQGMKESTPSKSCEDLRCENNNICQSTHLANGSQMDHAYCVCRGEWAGLRCEARIQATAKYITTEQVTIVLQATMSSSQTLTWKDLHVTELTVAFWNRNISDQCLLLPKKNPQRLIKLQGLLKNQEYIVCISNGAIDSCSFFRASLRNISSVPNCVHFQTRAVDDVPLDIGIVVVPCAVVVFLLIVITFLYCNRHSILLQLFLNVFCCRNCYWCRKQWKRKQRSGLMRKQRELSGDGLMSTDIPFDYEIESDIPSGSVEGSSFRKQNTSIASSYGSRKSACSPEARGLAPNVSSADVNTYLYEDQSLITPIYSPQNHKIMTLTYLEEEFCPSESEVSISNYIDPLYPGERPQSKHLAATYGVKGIIQNKVPQWGEDPHSNLPKACYPWANSKPQSPPSCFHSKESEMPNCMGTIKQQSNFNAYHPHPYDGGQDESILPSSHSSSSRSTLTDFDVKFRHLNHNTKPRPRPYSLPYTLMGTQPQRQALRHLGLYEHFDHNGPHQNSLNKTNQNPLTPTSMSPCLHSYFWQDDSTTGHRPEMINHLLSSPSRYNDILRAERSETPLLCYDNDCDAFASNTLPKSKKLPFPHIRAAHSEKVSPTTLPRAKAPYVTSKPAQRPTLLDLPTSGHSASFRKRFYPVSQTVSSSSTLPRRSKSRRRNVKDLITHFEYSLFFLKSSKSRRATDEEEEFRDLQSPVALERSKKSKKSRTSSFNRGRSTPTSSSESGRYSFKMGNPIFDGHPSEHILPPFCTHDKEDEENYNDDDDDDDDDDDRPCKENDNSTMPDDTSSSSIMTQSGHSIISSYGDEDTNLVTPFCTEDSDDEDDTCRDIKSLSGSLETLQGDLVTCESFLEPDDLNDAATITSSKSMDLNLADHREESEKLLL